MKRFKSAGAGLSALALLVFAILAGAASPSPTVVVDVVEAKTANYSIDSADNAKVLVMTSGSARTFNLPGLGSTDIGFRVTLVKGGAGTLTIQAPVGNSIADGAANGTLVDSVAGETWATVTLQYAAASKWKIAGANGTWTTSASTHYFGPISGTFATISSVALKSPIANPEFTGSVKNLAASEADFDLDEVKATGIGPGYGLVIVAETSTGKGGVFRLEKETITSVQADASYAVSKDTGSKINVYYETDQVKVQNKIAAGAIETAAIVAAGANYLVNDVLTLADGALGTVTVSTISGTAAALTATLSAPGTAYTVAVHATTGGTGQDCTVDVTAVDGVDGHIDTWAIAAGGTGYTVGDVLAIADGTDGTITVATIDKGHVTGVTLTAAGSGYTIATHATAGGTGTGCTIGVTAIVGLVLKVAYFGIS